jgi:hypothetical protein
MGFEALKKDLDSTGSVNEYVGNSSRRIVTLYQIISPTGDSDEVLYKTVDAAAESLLQDRGIGDALEAEMRADGVRPLSECCPTREREDEVAEWFSNNHGLVQDLIDKFDYRIITVLRWGEKK